MAFTVPPLSSATTYFDGQGRPTAQFQLYWQNFLRALAAEFGALEAAAAAQAAADAANAAAEAAQTSADNADTAATNAQSSADQAALDASLATSGVSGLTMMATDAGANATITISGHERVYGDGTSVVVTGGSVTGLAYSTAYYVYYSDPPRTGGAVTFLASTNLNDAIQTGSVHSLGSVITPAAAAPPVSGNPNLPPGVQEP
jgi:hypothetical protein